MGALANGVDARFAPGSNVKGAVGGKLVLPAAEPRPEPDRLPRPPVGSGAHHVRATRQRSGGLRAGRGTEKARACRRPRSAGQRLAARGESPRCCPLPDGSADLIVVPRLPALRRRAGPTGSSEQDVFLPRTGSPTSKGASSHGSTSGALWLAPAAGEVRMAAPLADREAIAYLERRFFRRRALRRQLLRRPGRVLARQAAVRRIVRRRAALGGPSAERPGAGLPAYVRAIAAEAGADVEHTRWALAAPGDYPLRRCFSSSSGPPARCPMRSSRSPATRN